MTCGHQGTLLVPDFGLKWSDHQQELFASSHWVDQDMCKMCVDFGMPKHRWYHGRDWSQRHAADDNCGDVRGGQNG